MGPCYQAASDFADKPNTRMIMGMMLATCAVAVHTIVSFFIGVAAVDKAAPGAASKDQEWGWFLRGNHSMLTAYAMNRTDMNVSSPTYGLWTAPPEWREHCILSGGMPISACSYHQAIEFPDFMNAFHVIYYVCVLLTVSTDVSYIFSFACEVKNLIQRVRRIRKEGRPMTERELTMVEATRSKGVLAVIILVVGFVPVQSMFSTFGAGMGLIHSLPSGIPYYGAQWNTIPFPKPEELTDLSAWNYMFLGLLDQGYLAFLRPRLLLFTLYPANGHFFTAFTGDLGITTFIEALLTRIYVIGIRRTIDLTIARYATIGLNFKLPQGMLTWKVWKKILTMQPVNIMLDPSIWFLGFYTLGMPPYLLDVDHWFTGYDSYDDEHVSKWLLLKGCFNRVMVTVYIGYTFSHVCVYFFDQYKLSQGISKSSLSAALRTRRRLAFISSTAAVLVGSIFVIMHPGMYTNGMLLQTFAWPGGFHSADASWMFGARDAASQMLATPVVVLITKIIYTAAYIIFVNPFSPFDVLQSKPLEQCCIKARTAPAKV